MKTLINFLIFNLLLLVAFPQIKYDRYFTDNALRIDYVRAGDANHDGVYLTQIKEEPYWAGPRHNLISPFDFGKYRVQAFDKKTNKLIFSYTYRTLFEEWQATPEAKIQQRAFYEVVRMPFPKNRIIVEFQTRNKHQVFETVFRTEINPDSDNIVRDLKFNFKTEKIINNGEANTNFDIAIIAEGYTKNEIKKFKKDAQKLVDYWINFPPFDEFKKNVNVYLIYSLSEESGTDIPQDSIWKNTVLSSHFNTFGTDRYLTVGDIKTMYDIAALVPFDHVSVLVNTEKYGGSGFYNFYDVSVSDNPYGLRVFVHEFGHSFGGLADEYWTSDVATENYYDLSVEPAEPNITTLKNFDAKWKKLVPDTVPVPSPALPRYENVVGAFEGGGYVARGIYRPMQTCIMKELSSPFCVVCSKTLEKIMNFYLDKKVQKGY